MELQVQVKMNPKLYLRDPESSELGRNIIKYSIQMICEIGFEELTFKKLAVQVGTTEASIYRYFENKHRLLIYVITWFWTWMEYQLVFHTNNLHDPSTKIKTIVNLLAFKEDDRFLLDHIDKDMLQKIVIAEGNKAYLTSHVTEDNKDMLFKPYKDLCHRIAQIFLEYNPAYPYPHSLGSTLIETAHHQLYFKDHLPRLTDFGGVAGDSELIGYLTHITFSALDKYSDKK